MDFRLIISITYFILATQAVNFQTGLLDAVALTSGNLQSKILTQNFLIEFANIPQVIAYFQHYDIFPGNAPDFSYSGITTKKFDLIFTSQSSYITGLIIRWIAVDDSRYEFLYSFNNLVSDGLNHVFSFPHSNPNHIKGLVGVMNFKESPDGPIDFGLDLQFTETDVTVNLVQTTNNLLSLGFFVMMGTADVMEISQKSTLNMMSQWNKFLYPPILAPINSLLVVAYQQINYVLPVPVDSLRLKLVVQLFNDSTFQYGVQTWYVSVIQSVGFQQMIMPTDIHINLPTLVKKFRCSKKKKPNNDLYPVKLTIISMNNWVITQTKTIYFDQSLQNSQIIVTMQCRLSTYVKASFLQCLGCDQVFKSWKQQCYSAINLIEFYIHLQQQDQVQQKLQITITGNGIEILHLVSNVNGEIPYSLLTVSLLEV